MPPCTFLLLLAAVVVCVHATDNGGVLGCGGFVSLSPELLEANPNAAPIDFSFASVVLLNSDGFAKQATEVAPNGYYFLPLHDHDKRAFTLRLKAKDGWTVVPESVPVSLGERGLCNGGQDIDFVVTGFSLVGKVLSAAPADGSKTVKLTQTGPAGVSVSLVVRDQPAPQPPRVLANTVTTEGGHFAFKNVLNGPKISVIASHPTWTFSSAEVAVPATTWGSLNVSATPLVVSGYEITGKVISSGEPMLGVTMFLFSSSVKTVPCKNAAVPSPFADRPNPLCWTTSNDKGVFSFSDVPVGAYVVVPHYKSQFTTFELVPSEVAVVVAHSTYTVPEAFQVAGFSVSGTVTDSKGVGIEGASISVDGVHRGVITDASGKYQLDQITSGSYLIEASKVHYEFPPVEKWRISPNVPSLPPLVASRVHLCGTVRLSPDFAFKSVRDVVLTDNTSGTRTTRSTNDQGSFCFSVRPGTYTLSPTISDSETEQGLLLDESTRSVTVDHTPVLGVTFTQVAGSVGGRIKCIHSPCDAGIVVTLTASSPSRSFRADTGASSTGEFAFHNVLPGEYKLSITRDTWCWTKPSFTVKVTNSEQNNFEFVQNGYMMTSVVSHDITLLFRLESSHVHNTSQINITHGTNHFCLRKPGVYILTPQSCYRFAQDTYTYDTAAPRVLELNAVAHQVSGVLLATLPENVPPPTDVVIEKRSGDTVEKIAATLATGSTAGPTAGTRQFSYSYSFWTALHESTELRPVSAGLLFYPQTQTNVVTETMRCAPPPAPFRGRPGLVLSGKVEPPLEGVRITVTPQRDGDAVVEVLTDSRGTYRTPPLYDDTSYVTTAALQGFEFTPGTVSGSFFSLKLGHLSVYVAEAGGAGLPGVLLSLSSKQYHNNNQTLDDGRFNFVDLSPGSYFVRPLLKEYVFTPPSQSFTIKQGENYKFEFTAVRTGFSCFGSVRSLNGEPERFVTMEARAINFPDEQYEETVSDEAGNFRLRGLVPNVSYVVRVKTDPNSRLERATPSEVNVTVAAANSVGNNFLVFRKNARFDITGRVVVNDPEYLKNLKVELVGQDEAVLRSISLTGPGYFEFPNQQKGKYSVRVVSSLSSRLYLFQTPASESEAKVALDQHTHLSLNFSVVPKADKQETGGSYFAFFVGVLGVLAFVFRKELEPVVLEMFARLSKPAAAPTKPTRGGKPAPGSGKGTR
eukprot:gnl/Spiro4/22956_TR11332_c0_g1_i1.p1 gnl/Spiro4/22956_TR11332_c0_g1~~gnl/Spiro4/22956_TR11332_c0_g1_i1.p1  ORF type:complete len:1203 (+),score=379.97 gnl/Spiro4/22956_TR11332_c0_g1_i1:30-3611(+)